MEKIILKRGGGKTTELIKKSAETGDYIVCSSQEEARYLQITAKEKGYDIPLPITYMDFIHKRYYGQNIKGFLIDNLEFFFECISKVPVNAVTMTHEIEEPTVEEECYEYPFPYYANPHNNGFVLQALFSKDEGLFFAKSKKELFEIVQSNGKFEQVVFDGLFDNHEYRLNAVTPTEE
jgi:hypothetical protein